MYTSEYYLDRGNKTLFWDVYSRTVVIRLCFGCIYQSITWTVVIRLCFGMYTSEYYLTRGNKTLFWDVYIRVLPGPW